MRIRISRPIFAVQLALCHAACGSDAANTPGPSAGGSSGSGGSSAGSGGSSAGSAGSGGSGIPGSFAECGGKTSTAKLERSTPTSTGDKPGSGTAKPSIAGSGPSSWTSILVMPIPDPRLTNRNTSRQPAATCAPPTSSAGPAAETATTAPQPGRCCTRPTTPPGPASIGFRTTPTKRASSASRSNWAAGLAVRTPSRPPRLGRKRSGGRCYCRTASRKPNFGKPTLGS